jgi:hypothetical protein
MLIILADLFDINNCIDESNTQVSLNEHFSRAKQILLIASKSYYEEVCSSRSPIGFDRLGIKRQLHSLMDQEFVRNGMQNERFRVVLLSNLDRKYLPLGWASTTIVYTFPENHGELAKRLFED